jgi:quinohemoprotein ethanol dehydrogenase
VVRDGTRVAAGMPSFKDLTESDIAAIRQYIRSRAAALRDGATIGP